MSEARKNKKVLIAVACVALAALIAVFALVYKHFKPDAQEGAKTITVAIVLAQGDEKTLTIKTDAEYLRGALEEKQLISGNEGEYGLYVTTVDGVTADEGKQEWWCFTRGGERLTTSVDTTPIKDGDKFAITLTTGW